MLISVGVALFCVCTQECIAMVTAVSTVTLLICKVQAFEEVKQMRLSKEEMLV